jgi:hypothetical protein
LMPHHLLAQGTHVGHGIAPLPPAAVAIDPIMGFGLARTDLPR